MPGSPQRGEVFEVWDVPVHGDASARSNSKERFAVVLQNDSYSQALGDGDDKTVIILPTTTVLTREGPAGIRVPKGTGGLPRESVILCDQIYTVKRAYCIRRKGRLDKDLVDAIERRVSFVLGLPVVKAPAPPAAAPNPPPPASAP